LAGTQFAGEVSVKTRPKKTQDIRPQTQDYPLLERVPRIVFSLWSLVFGLWSLMSLWAADVPVRAQCAMCRTAAASQGPQAARALDLAILILLIPAVAIFTGLFWFAYRQMKSKDQRPKTKD
jgi:hypothetical protein